MEAKLLPAQAQPFYVTISDAAYRLGVSEWSVKQLLRRGILRARKNGRRTSIEFDSLLKCAESLPPAKFAAPRRRRVLV